MPIGSVLERSGGERDKRRHGGREKDIDSKTKRKENKKKSLCDFFAL